MECNFIQKVVKHTFYFSLLFFIPFSYLVGWSEGLAVLTGALWGCVNLLLIKYLVQHILKTDKSYFKILSLMAFKFPLLYLSGYFLLVYMDALLLAVGLSFVFIGIFLYGLKGYVGKTAVFLAALSMGSLYASIESDVPEVPNIFTLLHKIFQTDLTYYLHDWENIIFSTIMAIVISIVFILGARKKEPIPTGFHNFIESAVETLRKFIIDILGPTGEKYVPLLGTLFIYIVMMNWMAVIPFMKPPTSSLNITIALAICVFFLVQYLNIKNQGIGGFLYHMAGSPKDLMGWLLVPLMLPIELLTQLTRPFTLAMRLFGNIAGEDILIGAASLFGVYLMSSINLIGGLPMQIPFMLLALLTGLMQALVFTLLSTIYILLSIPSHEEKSSH